MSMLAPNTPDQNLIKDSTTKTFVVDVIEASKTQPVIVDFWAPWCSPCRAMAPMFEQAARTLATEARFVKVNTDTEQALAARYAIRSIPTMILFRNGAEVKRSSGAMDAGSLARWVRT